MHDPSPPADDETPASDEFRRALEDFEHRPGAPGRDREAEAGTKVRGTILSIGDELTLVDFGGRSEGVVETKLLRDESGALTVSPGAALDLFVVESRDQVILAPSLRADPRQALRQMREARETGMPVSGRVTGVNAGGLAVDVAGLRAFCPVSQIEAGFCAEPSVYVGRTLEFLVTGVDDARRNVVLSRRALLKRGEEERARLLLESLKPGDERDGTVARLEPFGAFVGLGGVDGMVHVSEIRHERTAHPKDVLLVGQQVRVRVLRIERGRDGRLRIALSIRAALPDPWADAAQHYPQGARVRGSVASLADFGAFVTVAPGIEGLVHVSEVAAVRVPHPKDALVVGQEVEAIVLGCDPAKRRISLSIREALGAAAPAQATPDSGATERDEAEQPTALKPVDAGPTTMAIALREAMERARRKRGE